MHGTPYRWVAGIKRFAFPVNNDNQSVVKMAGIVGSPLIELEKAYRKLLLKIVNELRLEECEQIAFLAKLPAPTCHQETGRQYDNVRLHFMNTWSHWGILVP
jgi:hypothetical protein